MSIQHTVIFRLNHSLDSPQAAAFFADARALLSSIPGVQQFTIQRQVSEKSDLTHQLSMVFADESAYLAYNEHPTHVAFVANRWLPEVAEFQEYDFTEVEGD
ncbi:Dabb family protein [Demequina aurantiaca]|uniref:Dabb family protein n=1 Tax=Demequina aurantiaca TaxID=676200 RepID=UPI003D32D1B4